MAVSSLRELYTSSNGDRWEAGRDELGRLVIVHTPNVSSGGKPKLMDVGAFLATDHLWSRTRSARLNNPAETPVNGAGTIFLNACYADKTALWPGFVSHTRLLKGPGLGQGPFSFDAAIVGIS